MSTESLMRKLAALKAKALGTDNPHEAETFMLKVRELMLKHSIEEVEIADNPDDLVGENQVTNIARTSTWQRKLVHATAAFYGAKVYYNGGSRRGYEVFLIGTPGQRAVVQSMFDYLKKEVQRRARSMRGDTSRNARHIGYALKARLWSIVYLREADDQHEGKNALILKDRVEAYYDRVTSDFRVMSSKPVGTSLEARLHAQNINLSDQVRDDTDKTLYLE